MTPDQSGSEDFAALDWRTRAHFNLAWTSNTLILVAAAYVFFPAKSWGWGLLLGSVLGALALSMTYAYAKVFISPEGTGEV